MGIRGLNSFLRREKIPAAIRTLTKDDIVDEINAWKSDGKIPTIIIDIWAFCNYFEQNTVHVVFGGRLNKIRVEFEAFLSLLKSAGARLIFLFKKTGQAEGETWIHRHNEEYKRGIEFLQKIERMTTIEACDHFSSIFNRTQSLNTIVPIVLCQVASNFGEFHGNDLFLLKSSAGHVKLANSEDAVAIIGLDTYYLCFDGPWKFWSAKNFDANEIRFEEYNKEIIRRHFKLSCEQMQIVAVLGGKLMTSSRNLDILENHFKGSAHEHKLKRIMDYVKTLDSPITNAAVEATVELIFGSIVPSIVEEFNQSMESFNAIIRHDEDRFPDEEVAKLIINNPFCTGERILNRRTITCFSSFLDVTANDMKPLKALVLPWIQRMTGLLLKHVDGSKGGRRFISQLDDGVWENIEIEPETPDFDVPMLKHLVVGEMSHQEKIQILHFLIGGAIDKKIINDIPICYMIHLIILVHLVENDSMKLIEARAMMQAIVDEELMKIPKVFILPDALNIRAFRLSALYGQTYYKLLRCMSSVGLKDFAADIKLDNAHFQNLLNQLLEREDGRSQENRDTTQQLLEIIQN